MTLCVVRYVPYPSVVEREVRARASALHFTIDPIDEVEHV
jgi:hypothetical protein